MNATSENREIALPILTTWRFLIATEALLKAVQSRRQTTRKKQRIVISLGHILFSNKGISLGQTEGADMEELLQYQY